MSTPLLDPRRHAYRADLAAETLRGTVSAPRFAAGEMRQVVHSATPLRGRPDARDGWTTEALFGELVTVYDEKDGWAWVQLAGDGYVGYVRAAALSALVSEPTHRVRALGTFLYPVPDIKASPWMQVSMNATLSVDEAGPQFARLADSSFVPMRHITEIDRNVLDFVGVAERFVGVPYLWGGKSRLGLDCSGLVQVALQAAGIKAPRDSDMQEAELGLPLPIDAGLEGLERGDLMFWKGHVGVLTDAFSLLHANAYHMSVVVEPLQSAVARIARSGLDIAAIKRLERRSA